MCFFGIKKKWGGGFDLNVQLMSSGEEVNMLTAPNLLSIYVIKYMSAEKKSRSTRFSQVMSEALVQAYAKNQVS